MQEALARGNEGKKWHTLIDKVWSPQALEMAVRTVTARKGAARMDGQTTGAFAKRGAEGITVITRLLRGGRYEPDRSNGGGSNPERSGDRLPQAAPQG